MQAYIFTFVKRTHQNECCYNLCLRGCRGCPSVSHLLFADDSLLFVNTTIEEATNLRDLLNLYGSASAQKINFDKSEVTFSKNVETSQKKGA